MDNIIIFSVFGWKKVEWKSFLGNVDVGLIIKENYYKSIKCDVVWLSLRPLVELECHACRDYIIIIITLN